MRVEKSKSGSWEVYINRKSVACYASVETEGKNGYTKEEVERDFLRGFKLGGYKNTALYKLVE